ncbi:hypothetical protein LIER_24975 [Lithospermum erythrorhizon]|uniref:RING-type E3 ubiquitin transferase n=1 Tax=Lithospermum erythrorhizon TaxID=34254 RepID=A0AAV3R640_LITER
MAKPTKQINLNMDVVEPQDNHRQIEVSPLIVGILGIVAGVLLVASFHFMMLCLRNGRSQTTPRSTTSFPTSQRHAHQAQSSSNRSRTGQLQPITTQSTYAISDNKEENVVEVCAVCLGEFKEGEVIRILPHCGHMYHVPCIDKWLASHSNCPLCRANTVATTSSQRCPPQ